MSLSHLLALLCNLSSAQHFSTNSIVVFWTAQTYALLCNTRVMQGMEEVFNEWEKEAAALAEEIMAMEKTIVSPVFFQRLALKRRQRELFGHKSEQLTGVRGAAERVRASGAGLLARLRGKKTDEGSTSGRKAPNSKGGGDDDAAQPRSSGPSFAIRRKAPNASSSGGTNFTPGPARNLRFVKHIKAWGALSSY